MKKHYTPRYIVYLLIASISLLVSVVAGRIELAVLSLPFFTALALSLLFDRRPAIRLNHEISSARLFENDEILVSMRVQALTDVPLLEILDPLPEDTQLVAGNNDVVTRVKRGETREFTYRFRLARRIRFVLGRCVIRLHAASGLIYWEGLHQDAKDCVVYPKAPSLRENIKPFHTQVNVGNYISRVMGEGIEFGDLREYSPGDSVRRINWKASARTRRMHVNEYARERNCDVVVMIDSFQDAGSLGRSYLDRAARAAAGLSYNLLRNKNRVGFIEYGGRFLWLVPSLGSRQWYRILESLTEMQVKRRYAIQDLASVPGRILPTQALIVAFTPLLDERFTNALLDLHNRGYNTVALCLSPAELVRETAVRPAERIALDLWELETDAAVTDLQNIGFPILRWNPEEPLELVARSIRALQQRRRIS